MLLDYQPNMLYAFAFSLCRAQDPILFFYYVKSACNAFFPVARKVCMLQGPPNNFWSGPKK